MSPPNIPPFCLYEQKFRVLNTSLRAQRRLFRTYICNIKSQFTVLFFACPLSRFPCFTHVGDMGVKKGNFVTPDRKRSRNIYCSLWPNPTLRDGKAEVGFTRASSGATQLL
ncbi:unnamed protein product [Scytosiphon promiscuus]